MATAKAKLIEKARQFAALPWRDAGHGIEVLLISSRGTGRWVIPKGWPIKGFAPHASAAREAFEEAGVGGIIGKGALG
ncbi:MAG: NUDIX hydrolase, partial [Aestuariivirga sp.]